MTRAKRYANYKGGRKDVDEKKNVVQNEKGIEHEDKEKKWRVSYSGRCERSARYMKGTKL